MAVDGVVDFVKRDASTVERLLEGDALRPVPGLRVRITLAHPGVEQHKATLMADEVAVHGFHSRLPRARLLGQSDEGSEKQPGYFVHAHVPDRMGYRAECRHGQT